MKQGSLVQLTDGSFARFLFTQLGKGYHVIAHGHECVVSHLYSVDWNYIPGEYTIDSVHECKV